MSTFTAPRWHPAIAALVLLTACGSSSTTQSSSSSAATVAATVPVVTSPPPTVPPTTPSPQAIVSLSPSATEMLFAIGAGKQVVAVDDQSNYPPEAPKTDLSGFTPNVEAIAAKHPDLVVIANDTKGLVAGLEALHITTLLQPAASTLADSYHELRELGRVTGYGTEADAVIADMQAKIATIVDKYKVTKPRTVYHELDQTYFTATSKTFIGQAYSLLGLTNIGDAADSADAAGYPQLSAEAVVTANPDLIVLADTVCCQQTAQTVAARPAWSNISAVKHQAIVEANDDVASRWGPRFVDFLNQIALAVSKLPS